MLKIRKFSSSLRQKISRLPATVWLLILILLPLNFLCLKEMLEKENSSSELELAFASPADSVSAENPLSKILAFTVSSKNNKNAPCQIFFLLDQETVLQKEITIKKGTESFLAEKALEDKLIEKGNGKMEITLQCEKSQENIYKYIKTSL